MAANRKDIKKVSIIIPCYNEVRNITEVIDLVAGVEIGFDKEIIVVDDGSSDGTMKILEEMKSRRGDSDILKVHFSMLNSGKGFAIRIGLKYVTGDIVIIQDADLEYDPRDYPRLIEPIIGGAADAGGGSRF